MPRHEHHRHLHGELRLHRRVLWCHVAHHVRHRETHWLHALCTRTCQLLLLESHLLSHHSLVHLLVLHLHLNLVLLHLLEHLLLVSIVGVALVRGWLHGLHPHHRHHSHCWHLLSTRFFFCFSLFFLNALLLCSFSFFLFHFCQSVSFFFQELLFLLLANLFLQLHQFSVTFLRLGNLT